MRCTGEVQRLDKIAWGDFEQQKAVPKGGGQEARSNMTWMVPCRQLSLGSQGKPSRLGALSWADPAHPCARDTFESFHFVADIAIEHEQEALSRDRRVCPSVRPPRTFGTKSQ